MESKNVRTKRDNKKFLRNLRKKNLYWECRFPEDLIPFFGMRDYFFRSVNGFQDKIKDLENTLDSEKVVEIAGESLDKIYDRTLRLGVYNLVWCWAIGYGISKLLD